MYFSFIAFQVANIAYGFVDGVLMHHRDKASCCAGWLPYPAHDEILEDKY